MDRTQAKNQELMERLGQYQDATPEEKQYQLEKAIRDYFSDMSEEEKEDVLLLVDIFYNDHGKEVVHAALREDAIFPENVVGSEAKAPKLLVSPKTPACKPVLHAHI